MNRSKETVIHLCNVIMFVGSSLLTMTSDFLVSSQDIELAPVGVTKISISNPQRKARMDMYNNYFRELAKKAKISDVEPSSSMCSPASIAESSPDSSEVS